MIYKVLTSGKNIKKVIIFKKIFGTNKPNIDLTKNLNAKESLTQCTFKTLFNLLNLKNINYIFQYFGIQIFNIQFSYKILTKLNQNQKDTTFLKLLLN